MKTRFAALLCTLTVTACGSSDHPAQDPTTASVTHAAPSDSTNEGSNASAARTPAPSADAPRVTETATAGAPGERSAYASTDSTKAEASHGGAQAAAEVSPGAASNQAGTSPTVDPDNSGVNERDRHGALTPMDQGAGGADRQTTAAIRRGVVADKSLSFGAKNVKIITTGGKVTLRGPVKTDQEKATIEALARQAPGVTEVDNQIEVKVK